MTWAATAAANPALTPKTHWLPVPPMISIKKSDATKPSSIVPCKKHRIFSITSVHIITRREIQTKETSATARQGKSRTHTNYRVDGALCHFYPAPPSGRKGPAEKTTKAQPTTGKTSGKSPARVLVLITLLVYLVYTNIGYQYSYETTRYWPEKLSPFAV